MRLQLSHKVTRSDVPKGDDGGAINFAGGKKIAALIPYRFIILVLSGMGEVRRGRDRGKVQVRR